MSVETNDPVTEEELIALGEHPEPWTAEIGASGEPEKVYIGERWAFELTNTTPEEGRLAAAGPRLLAEVRRLRTRERAASVRPSLAPDIVDQRRGTVENGTGLGGWRQVTLWPQYDPEERIEITGDSTGVLLAIVSNVGAPGNAVFLTLAELERITTEARSLAAKSR
jgi:hypothetical protein